MSGNYLRREYHSIFPHSNLVLDIMNSIPYHFPIFYSFLILVKNVEARYTGNIIRDFLK